MKITIEQTRQTAVEASPNVMAVAAMFGLGTDRTRRLVTVPRTALELHAGSVLFVTGPSGGGKSTVLRLIAEQASGREGVHVIDFCRLPRLAERPLVDVVAGLLGGATAVDGRGPALKRVFNLLSLAGLNDAFVMLRRPSELSDGQRYRLRLAQAFAAVDELRGDLVVILADEFAATLDRTTAAVIARNVHRFTRRSPRVCFVAASSHDDLLEALNPDVLIDKPLGGEIEVLTRQSKQAIEEGRHETNNSITTGQPPPPSASTPAETESVNET